MVARKTTKKPNRPHSTFLDATIVARKLGLLKGPRATLTVDEPKALIERAKAKTGAKTDTELVHLALAYVATTDEYMSWLISQRGTIPREIDLEF